MSNRRKVRDSLPPPHPPDAMCDGCGGPLALNCVYVFQVPPGGVSRWGPGQVALPHLVQACSDACLFQMRERGWRDPDDLEKAALEEYWRSP
jgi:hypothetical protein